jgi:uncharacterized protein YjbJ (UPF0337 family)
MDKHRIKGSLKKVSGSLKEAAGKLLGDKSKDGSRRQGDKT